MEQSFPRTWISMVTLMPVGPRIQTTHAPPLALYLLATVEPFPDLVSYRAWSHFPLQNWSTSDLAMLGNTSLGSSPSLRRLDIRRRLPQSYSVTIKQPSSYVVIRNSRPRPSTSNRSTISFETTWSERERQWSDMFPPRTWWQIYSQNPL